MRLPLSLQALLYSSSRVMSDGEYSEKESGDEEWEDSEDEEEKAAREFRKTKKMAR